MTLVEKHKYTVITFLHNQKLIKIKIIQFLLDTNDTENRSLGNHIKRTAQRISTMKRRWWHPYGDFVLKIKKNNINLLYYIELFVTILPFKMFYLGQKGLILVKIQHKEHLNQLSMQAAIFSLKKDKMTHSKADWIKLLNFLYLIHGTTHLWEFLCNKARKTRR